MSSYRILPTIKDLKFKFIGEEGELSEINKIDKNTNEDDKEIIEYGIMVVGDSLTGKSSFCYRFALDDFDLEIKPSIETSCFCKTIILFDKEIKIYLIDMETVQVAPLTEEEENDLYKIIDGIVFIYDITNYESFENLEKILNNMKKKIDLKKIHTIMVGNKNDLGFLRNIDFDEAKEKALKLGFELKEINCNRDEEMVHNVMKNLIAKIYVDSLENYEKEKLIKQVKEL